MTTSQTCQLLIPTQRRANALMLIKSHIYTITRATHSNSRITLAKLNSPSTWMSKISIITRRIAISAKIHILNAMATQPRLHQTLERITRMIATDSYRLIRLNNQHFENKTIKQNTFNSITHRHSRKTPQTANTATGRPAKDHRQKQNSPQKYEKNQKTTC